MRASALLACCMFAIGAGLARRVAAQAGLLPLMRHVFPALGPGARRDRRGAGRVLTGTPGVGPLDLLAAVASRVPALSRGPACSALRRRGPCAPRSSARRRRRRGCNGRSTSAARISSMLVGWVSCRRRRPGPRALPRARPARRARRGRDEHDIDLLVMGAEAPRLSGVRGGDRLVPGPAGAAASSSRRCSRRSSATCRSPRSTPRGSSASPTRTRARSLGAVQAR